MFPERLFSTPITISPNEASFLRRAFVHYVSDGYYTIDKVHLEPGVGIIERIEVVLYWAECKSVPDS